MGEIALNGKLRPVNGALSIAIAAKENGFKQIILPDKNIKEASMVDGIDVIPAKDLKEVVHFLLGDKSLKIAESEFEK